MKKAFFEVNGMASLVGTVRERAQALQGQIDHAEMMRRFWVIKLGELGKQLAEVQASCPHPEVSAIKEACGERGLTCRDCGWTS